MRVGRSEATHVERRTVCVTHNSVHLGRVHDWGHLHMLLLTEAKYFAIARDVNLDRL